METTFIYSLNCPNSNEIRYIGKANNPFYRLRKHKEESLRGTKTHKCNWIRSLIAKSLSPNLEILDEVPMVEWEFWEEYYISLYKSWGFNLINGTIGGDGIPLMTKEIRQKISIKNKGKQGPMLGKKHSELAKKRMSESATGRKMTEQAKQKISDFISQPILQFTKKGEFIKEWKSAEYAQRELNIYHIRSVIKGKDTRQFAGGFMWKDKPANKIYPDFITI